MPCLPPAVAITSEGLTRAPNSRFLFSSRRRHTRYIDDWSSDVCSSDLGVGPRGPVVLDEVRPQLRPAREPAHELAELGRVHAGTATVPSARPGLATASACSTAGPSAATGGGSSTGRSLPRTRRSTPTVPIIASSARGP